MASGAALVLDVSTPTFRLWGRAGKLKSKRHPLIGYRSYRREDREPLLKKAASLRAAAEGCHA